MTYELMTIILISIRGLIWSYDYTIILIEYDINYAMGFFAMTDFADT